MSPALDLGIADTKALDDIALIVRNDGIGYPAAMRRIEEILESTGR